MWQNTSYLRLVLEVNAWHASRQTGIKRHLWFYDQVKSGGPWDLKCAVKAGASRTRARFGFCGSTISAEDYGNIHYGYVGNACKISKYALLYGSITAHWLEWRFRHLRNEYRDHRKIALGYYLYQQWGKRNAYRFVR